MSLTGTETYVLFMLFVSMDPPAVRTLATALRTQATAADETASRIQTAMWLSELSSLVPDRLTARSETWRTAAGVLETRATMAESFHINLLPSGSDPVAAPIAPVRVTDDAALGATYQQLIGMSDGERADAVAAMSDEELAGILDFASDLPTDDGALAALLLPVIDDERVEGWAAGLEDVHSITDLNEAIANWSGSDNDPILDQLISDRNALIFALTGDSETWRYDPAIAALAEMLGLEYTQAEGRLDANRIHDLTTQIDGWPGTHNDPILDELIADRDALLDKWIAADTFPPEIAAVALPLLTVAEIVQVEQRHPNTVSIAALDHIVTSHDAAALPGDPLSREIEKLRDVRDALVASMAGTDSAIGLDVNVASVAQLNGISYEEAEQGMLVGRIEGQTNDLQFLPDGPVRSAMLAERDELVAQLVGGNELLSPVMAAFLDSGYSVNEAYIAAVELLQGEIEAAELAASMSDENGFFSGIPGGVQVGDIADGLWDGLKASLGDAWGLVTGAAGFLWNAVTNPTEIDDMVAEQWDVAMELIDMIWGAIMSGDVEMIVEEILLPIFGINMDDLRERGLDYALAFALGSNPDLLLTGGAAAFAKIDNLRDLGRLADGADTLDGNGIDLDAPDLNDAELGAIHRCTGDEIYAEVNQGLRTGDSVLLARHADDIELIRTGLDKLPDYEGITYRGIFRDGPPPDGVIATYEPGTLVRENQFTSTDINRGFEGHLQFVVEGQTGHRIQEFSEYAGAENEVLFNMETDFLVNSRSFDEASNTWTVHMTEVPDA